MNNFNFQESTSKIQKNLDISKVVSYKSALCSCCKKWINQFRVNGLEVVNNVAEVITEIQKKYNVPNNLRSCNSAK